MLKLLTWYVSRIGVLYWEWEWRGDAAATASWAAAGGWEDGYVTSMLGQQDDMFTQAEN